MSGRFLGKVALVTGSSAGIGRGVAELFAEEGAKLAITGRNLASLQETKNLLLSKKTKESDILTISGDLTNENFQRKIVDETIEKFGKLDILINNAGSAGPEKMSGKGFEMSMEIYDYVMNLNLRSVLNVTRTALPHLIKSKGEIVNMSSIAALPLAFQSFPYYAMSKSALSQLTRSLAATYIKDGVRVNAVNPGLITTDIMKKQGLTAQQQDEVEQKLCQIPDLIPAGYPGTIRDVAEAVAFLSDRQRSRYIIGQCLVIDGGATVVNAYLSAYKML